MAEHPAARRLYADRCPACGTHVCSPVIKTQVGQDEMQCRYRCCCCGHIWRTGWSISFVEGREAA